MPVMEPVPQRRLSNGPAPAGERPDRFRLLLAGVLAAAALFRAAYFFELLDSPFGRHPILDAGYYYGWAQRLAAGNFRLAGDFSGNPLYPYFLAFLVRSLRAGPVLIRAVQHLLGVITCLLVYHCGRKIFRPRTGLLAALLFAVFPLAVFYEGWLLSTALEVFLMVALLAALLSADRPSRWGWLGGGVLAGLLILARPSLVPLGAAAWIILGTAREKFRRRAAKLLLFGLGLLLPLVPFSLQYYAHEKEFALISPHGGENFYIGNNPEASGLGRMPEFARGIPELQRRDFQKEASRLTGREFSPARSSRFWFGRGLAFIGSHPLRFLRLLVLKVYLFLCGVDFFDNYNLDFFRGQFAPLAFPFSWRILSALALGGLVAGRRRGRPDDLLYIFIVSYISSIALFFVTSRFRLPAVPLFCLAAAAGMAAVFDNFRRRCFFPAAGRIVLMIVLFIVLAGPALRAPLNATYTTAAEVYAREGEMDRAADFLEKARGAFAGEDLPLSFGSYRHQLAWAQIELKRGNEEEAEKIVARILAEVKDRPGPLHFEIANVWAENLYYEKAEEHYRAALETEPENFRVWSNLGLTLKNQGKPEEAEEAFRAAIELNPGYAPAHGNLGILYLEREDWEEACRQFQIALELDPGGTARLRIARAYCLRRLGRPAEAEEELERCPPELLERLWPGRRGE